MQKGFWSVNGIAWAILLAGFSALEPGEAPPKVAQDLGQVRCAVVDTSRSAVYAVAYDRNQLVRLDAEGVRTADLPLGAGPVAASLSADARYLVIANSLAGTATLVDLGTFSVAATIPCGKDPSAVVALPDGRFAVLNALSDTLTVFSPQTPGSPSTVDGIGGLPVAATLCDDELLVATRVPAALHRLNAQTLEKMGTIMLDSPAVALCAMQDHKIVAALVDKLVTVDVNTGAIQALVSGAYRDVDWTGTQLLALGEAGVDRFGPDFRPAGQFPLESPGYSITLNSGVAAICAPAAKAVYLAGAWPQPAASPTPIATPPAVPEPVPAVPEPAPVALEPAKKKQEPMHEPPAPVEAAPVAVTPDPAPVPPPAARPAPEAPAAPVAPELPAPAVSAEQPAPPPSEPSRRAYPRMPVGKVEHGAPYLGRPSTLPFFDEERPSIFSALGAKHDFAAGEGGFRVPDWTQPFENLRARDELVFSQEGSVTARGDVQLQLGDTHFGAEELDYSAAAGVMSARGNVSLTQAESAMTADELRYTLPAAPAEAPGLMAVDEQEIARQRISRGHLEARNLYIKEPVRWIKVEGLDYDFASNTGTATNFKGQAGPFVFGGAKLRVLGPATASGEDVWVTTCDHDPPHYRILVKKAELRPDQTLSGSRAAFELGTTKTPLVWPKWSRNLGEDRNLSFDFDSGRRAEIGSYVNLAQQFKVNDDVSLGYRLMPTSKGGIGLGLEGEYDFTGTPAALLYGGKGSFESLETTKDRGYVGLYHRHILTPEAILLMQVEQWSDSDFYKDFFETYKNRTEPRSFLNLTYTQPTYMATATARKDLNNFVAETERMPEVTFHMFERPIRNNLYASFDTINGYNEREPAGNHSVRSINIGRLTYDWDPVEALNIAPFVEAEASWYSDDVSPPEGFGRDSRSDTRLSSTFGVTLQSRFHREYGGVFNFSGFKHIVVPSVTYSYRPQSSMSVESTPHFDAYDNVYGRSRLESKLANIVLGRDAATGQVWQVASLTLYQGTDFSNELRKSDDYEAEFDLRPRPYWGWLSAAEHHGITREFDVDQPYVVQTTLIDWAERLTGKSSSPELAYRYNARFGDYDRILSYFYYDNTRLGGRVSGRLGFAYTETQARVFNREMLYGAGYKLSDKWGVAFEHRYDFERDELTRQMYEIRRNLHCWEAALQFRDRPSGWDIGLQLSLTAFPGNRVGF